MTTGRRPISVSSRRSGWLRGSSPVRYVAATISRSSRSLRATKARKSRVDRSAQCRSSTTSSTGPRSPSRFRTSSHSRALPRCPDEWSEGSSSSRSASAATSGANGNASPPNSMLSPCSTRNPLLARVPFELLREPRLPDAGLAGQQHDPRLPELRRGEQVVE